MVEHSWSDTTIYGGEVSNVVASLSIEHIATEKTQAALEAIQSANAKLIAAAPQMLQALEAVMEKDTDAEAIVRAAFEQATT